MANIFNYLISIVFAVMSVVIAIGVIVRILRDRFSTEKSINAVVSDKQSYESHSYSKSGAHSSNKKYIVSFDTSKGVMHFEVSEYSYNGYRIKEKGILKYKGSRLISFE